MTKLPKNNYEVCGIKLYYKEAECNVFASHWTGIGTLLCIRADGVNSSGCKNITYETTEDNLLLGWKSYDKIGMREESED